MKLIDQFKAARRVSTPIVAINTPDPGATIESIRELLNGKDPSPLLVWDIITGIKGKNEKGIDAAVTIAEETQFNPTAALIQAAKLPNKSILIYHLANRFIDGPSIIQAIWNLRDAFKATNRMLVLLGPSIALPPELSGDVTVFEEPLPTADELTTIIKHVHDDANVKISPDKSVLGVEALTGLSSFAAEQVTAMSLTKSGLDIDGLWNRKRQLIDETPGLRVFRDNIGLDDIGGVQTVKTFIGKVMAGKARPNAVVFIDEIEKMLAGAAGDMSGVAQDQLGVVLSFMQDNNAAGMIFIGPPGSAKSMVAKAAGTAGGVPTIQLDLGGLKGSLVGQSEQQLRAALQVVTAVSNGKSLWIATCNSIGSLPPELRRRFTLGTFFFDLPTLIERQAIWELYLDKYEVSADESPSDDGWTGAEIKQCCELAWRLDCSLIEAAKFIVPVSKSAADQVEKLRNQASGRFLSASNSGLYTREQPEENNQPTTGRRRGALEVA